MRLCSSKVFLLLQTDLHIYTVDSIQQHISALFSLTDISVSSRSHFYKFTAIPKKEAVAACCNSEDGLEVEEEVKKCSLHLISSHKTPHTSATEIKKSAGRSAQEEEKNIWLLILFNFHPAWWSVFYLKSYCWVLYVLKKVDYSAVVSVTAVIMLYLCIMYGFVLYACLHCTTERIFAHRLSQTVCQLRLHHSRLATRLVSFGILYIHIKIIWV